jgi:hypothetical protein
MNCGVVAIQLQKHLKIRPPSSAFWKYTWCEVLGPPSVALETRHLRPFIAQAF